MARRVVHRSIVDEQWMAEWLEFGFAELGRFLARHRAFAEFCERRDNPPRKRPKRKDCP